MRGTFNTSNLDHTTWEGTPQDHYQRHKEMQIQRKRMFQEVPPFAKPKKNASIMPPNSPALELHSEYTDPCLLLEPHPPMAPTADSVAVKAVQFTDNVPVATESS